MIRRSLSTLAALAVVLAFATAPGAATTTPPTTKTVAPAKTSAKSTASTKTTAKAPSKPAAKPIRKPAVTVSPTAAVLRVAVEGQFAPFSEVGKDGRLKGFDVDIANAICAEIKRRCQLVQREWPHIQDGVLGKNPRLWTEVDTIISSVSINDTRRQTSDFTQSYYHIPARFIRRRDDKVEVTAAGLVGKRIGVQGQTTHDEFVTATFGKTAQIVRFESLPEAAKALAEGRLDLVMADSLALELGTLRTPAGAKLEFVGPGYTDRGWFGDGAGIVVAKGQSELLAQLESALAAIRSDGTYARISKAYFGFDLGAR